MILKFFKSAGDFRKWLMKNHEKNTELWVGFYKGGKEGMSQKEANDQAICFGWVLAIVKRNDEFSYGIRYVKRRPKSPWSPANMKRAKELQKLGLMHKSGLKSLAGRDKEKSEGLATELTRSQLKKFRAYTTAWDFWEKQTPSYRKYMSQWVNGAKLEETREKRLAMLMEDSGNGSKLRRVVEATEKIKPKYPQGATPIEAAMGPVTSAELRNVGIKTVEQLRALGWEEALQKVCEVYPHRINVNMAVGLIAAIENVSWKKLDPHLKAEAKAMVVGLKREFGSR